MKKILLAFMGMVFFAHMVHAANTVFYKLIRKDAVNEQHTIYPNSQGGLYNGYSGWVNYTAVASQYINNSSLESTCKFAGWERGTTSSTYPENSQYNRGLIVCDLTRMARDQKDIEDGKISGSSFPYLFWQEEWQERRGENPCQEFFDTLYAQNAITTPQCYTWRGGFYKHFNILKPNGLGGSWWESREAPRAYWARHITFNQFVTGNENTSWKEQECGWDMTGDAKNCTDTYWHTIMDPYALRDAIKSKNLHCRKPDGSYFTDNNYKVSVTVTAPSTGHKRINMSRDACPTTYWDGSHTTAFVEYFSQWACYAARSANPNTSTGCDTVYDNTVSLWLNQTYCRSYRDNRTVCGEGEKTYPFRSRIFKCKKAYNQIWGSKLHPECYAVYGVQFRDSYQVGWTYGNYTNNITTAKSTTQASYPEMTCKWDGKSDSFNYGHDEYVDKNLVCTCKANTFLGEDDCNNSITDSDMQYCEYDSSNGNCGWRLKSCADWSGERFKSESACQYKRNKSNRILTTYCINRKDGACHWSLETATNTVKSCKGDSGYIKKIDNNRACQRIKAK